MRKFLQISILLAITLTFSVAQGQNARLQVIHNAADVSIPSVDVYVWNVTTDNLVFKLENFAFRSATPFQDVPANDSLVVVFADSTSSGVTNQVLTTIPLGSLTESISYVAIATGLTVSASYATNPDGLTTDFELVVKSNAMEFSQTDFVELFAMHGITDAPTIDVVARDVDIIFDDAAYGSMTDYYSLWADIYFMDITPADDNFTNIISFEVDFTDYAGASATLFLSGFLTPGDNQNGSGFGLFAALSDGTVLEFPVIPPARLQVIHNAADIAAETVDIYLWNENANRTLLKLEDISFRSATPFVDIPGEIPLSIIVADPSSIDATDQVLSTISLGTLNHGEIYVVMANGLLTPGSYATNPDGRSTAFEIVVKTNAKEFSLLDDLESIVIHGVSDAPTIDILARDVGIVADSLAYGDTTDYIAIFPDLYTLDVTPAGDNSTILFSFQANLSQLAGETATIFASGFLSPQTNQNGPAFGLFAALSNGTVVEFQRIAPSRMQIVHNAADIAADTVDVYLWDSNADTLVLKLDNLGFRSATPFVNVPSNIPFNVIVANQTSVNAGDQVLTTIPIGTLDPEETYVAIANGVINPGTYATNPDGRNTVFDILVKSGVREISSSDQVEFFALHGVSDAPTIDIVTRSANILVDNAAYRDMTGYIPLIADVYTLDVTEGNNNSNIVASFTADLSQLAGASAMVFASGFLTPATNQNGASFGLFAVLNDGSVVEFPLIPEVILPARLQVVHNAADIAADTVDVYLWNSDADTLVLKLDNFGFRSATPFVNVPSNDSLNVIVANRTSANAGNQVFTTIPLGALNPQESYVAIANGVIIPGLYAANPDGRSTAFNVVLKSGARETSTGNQVEFFVLHGVSDAPTIDVFARGNVDPLVDNAAYGDMTDYLQVSADLYTLDVTPANDNSTILASFTADLSQLGAASATVFASGFLIPGTNQNGPEFGIFVALSDGSVIVLTPVTNLDTANGFEIPGQYKLSQNYPNPFNPTTTISYELPQESVVDISVYNISGQKVGQVYSGKQYAGVHSHIFDATNLSSGVYFYMIDAGNFRQTRKMILVR